MGLDETSGGKNEVENGYLLTFGRDCAYEKANQFTATEKGIAVIYIGDLGEDDIVHLSKKTLL